MCSSSCIDAGNKGPRARGTDLFLKVYLYKLTTPLIARYDAVFSAVSCDLK